MQTRLPVITFLLILTVACSAQSKPTFALDEEQTQTPEQTAKSLNILPILQQLQLLTNASDSDQMLLQVRLNQRLILEIATASLQVDETVNEIDAEIGEARELQNFLIAKRQRTINLLDLSSLGMRGSVSTASAALGLTTHARAAGVLSIISGSSTTALSAIGLAVHSRSSSILEIPSNMLARIFDLPGDPNNIYPPIVAKFMNSSAPNDAEHLTRQQRLILTWTKLGRIPPQDSLQAQEKIRRLASKPGDNIKLSIGDLGDRQAMLYDFRARLSFLKKDLAALLEELPRDPIPSEEAGQ